MSTPEESRRRPRGKPQLDATRLSRDLASLFPIPEVPPVRDATILAAARHHLAQVVRPRTYPVAWRRAAAAAVLLLVLAGATRWFDPTDVPLAGDLDRDGRRTIVDVYRIARTVQLGVRTAGADVDGDGSIDARDLEIVLADTVLLDPPAVGSGG